MDPNDQLETSIKETEPPAPPATDSPTAQEPPAQEAPPDLEEISEKDFVAWDKAQADVEDGTAPAAPEPPAGEKTPPAPVSAPGEVSPGPEELAKLREAARIVEEFDKDPVAFVQNNPDLGKRLDEARARTAETMRQGKRPEWAYADTLQLELPNDPRAWRQFAGWRVSDIKAAVDNGQVAAEEYQAVLTALSRDQGVARGHWEARQRMEQEAIHSQARQAWDTFADELRKDDPKATEAALRQEMDKVTAFARQFRPTPSVMRRIMNYDKDIAAAEVRGEQRGRQSLLKDMDKAGKAPAAASSGVNAGAGAGTLLARWQSTDSPESRATFLDGLNEKQFRAMEKQAKDAGVSLK